MPALQARLPHRLGVSTRRRRLHSVAFRRAVLPRASLLPPQASVALTEPHAASALLAEGLNQLSTVLKGDVGSVVRSVTSAVENGLEAASTGVSELPGASDLHVAFGDFVQRAVHVAEELPGAADLGAAVDGVLQQALSGAENLPGAPDIGSAVGGLLQRAVRAAEELPGVSSAVEGAVRAAGSEASAAASSALSGGVEPHWGTSAGLHWLERAIQQSQAAAEQAQGALPDAEVSAQAQRALQAAQAAVTEILAALRDLVGPGLDISQLGDSSPVQAVQQAAERLAQACAGLAGAAGPLLERLGVDSSATWSSLSHHNGYSPEALAALAAALALVIRVSTPARGSAQPAQPPPPKRWDAGLIAAYYAQRPVAVLYRSMQVALYAGGVGLGLLADYLQGNLDENAAQRAGQLRRAIEKLGPAYVKVAQALSTRVDILSPSYLAEIERLQDRVPTFSDTTAWNAIAEGLGPVEATFAKLSPSPVAAASLGQVYKGVLLPALGGHAVAVKVRRPGVQAQVALDLHIMRQVAVAARRLPSVRSNWAGVIDAWAVSFLEEMDYELESDNARRFKADVAAEQLSGIVVPEVYQATAGVLVSEWIDGEKLSESRSGDVRELCNTLLNSYLVQLLDTGFLHADPHPGNLMRTPDGRLAILDFGLMTQVPEDTSLALVEYIAHLSVSDWPAVAEDLVKLGFIPADAPSPRTSGLAEPLGRILEQLVAGGGAAKVNIEGVLAELDSLGRTFPYFQVPPYFALILRCFSVIEGIALRVDPDYAIVKECWPYIARRLLTDDHPRAKEALRQLLFGEGEHIDVARLERLVQGVGNFTVAGLDPAGPQRQRSASASEPAEQAPVLNDTAKQALLVLFSRTGSPAQELLVGEAAAYVDAGVRQLASQLIGQLLGSAPAVLSATATQALGPWRPLLLPFPTPVEQLGWLAPVMQPSESDRKVLDSASGIARAVGANVSAPRLDAQGLAQAGRLGAELLPLLPELLPGVGKIASVFSAKLISRTRQRLEAPADAGYSAPMDL